MAYHRKGDRDLLILGNFQTEAQDVVLPEGMNNIILNNMDKASIQDGVLHMEGYQFLVIE